MSNELATPKILVCPEDKQRTFATNFGLPLTRTNISYFLPLNASESDPLAILSGDDNLLQNGKPVYPGRVNLSTSPATWTANRHHGMGNILMGDGSVQTEILIGFKGQPGIALATNFIVIP